MTQGRRVTCRKIVKKEKSKKTNFLATDNKTREPGVNFSNIFLSSFFHVNIVRFLYSFEPTVNTLLQLLTRLVGIIRITFLLRVQSKQHQILHVKVLIKDRSTKAVEGRQVY